MSATGSFKGISCLTGRLISGSVDTLGKVIGAHIDLVHDLQGAALHKIGPFSTPGTSFTRAFKNVGIF